MRTGGRRIMLLRLRPAGEGGGDIMSESLTSVDLLAIMLRAEAGSDVPALLATIAQLLEAIEPFAHEGFSGLDTGNWIRNWEQVRAVYERLAPAHLHPFEGRASVVALQQMTERVPTTRPL